MCPSTRFQGTAGRLLPLRSGLVRTSVRQWASGRVKVRDWQRVDSTNDLPCRGHWAIHLEQQQAVSKWECVGLNGEDGDELSSLRMSPGRNMDEVTICALYGGPFQMANKSVGVKIEGNMRTLKS